LSALGYLYLGDEGEFADSGAVGMLDLVAALEWVKRNIAAFGGDASRVLIFGQSGGGAKVSHLMAIPSATGLFHRAGIMSGPRLTGMSREAAAKASDQLLGKLGLARGDAHAASAAVLHDPRRAGAGRGGRSRARGSAARICPGAR
jgi:para-nitrobenzyl esterase